MSKPVEKQTNLPDADLAFQALIGGGFREVLIALEKIGQDTATQGSKNAPKATGHLRASINAYAAVQIEKVKGGLRMEKTVVAATEYAAIQHENLVYKHKDGKAKYLTEPFAAKLQIYQGMIARALNENARRLGIRGKK